MFTVKIPSSQEIYWVAAAVLIASSTPAVSQPLWLNLSTGMSKAEVKALYPTKRIEIAPGCHAALSFEYGRDGLSVINLEWSVKDTSPRCGDVVSQTMRAKYGEPASATREVQYNDCGNSYAGGVMGALSALCESMGGDEPDYFRYSRWIAEGVEITLKRDSTSESGWWAVYRPAVTASEEAASKLAHYPLGRLLAQASHPMVGARASEMAPPGPCFIR